MTDTSRAPSPVREVVAQRRYWQWSATLQAARLPPLMAPLAFVLAGSAAGDYRVGALMVTAATLAGVAASPFAGRRLDRLGPAIGAPRVLGWSALVLVLLALAVARQAPPPVLLLLAALAGALPAGVSGAMRSLLNAIVPPRQLGPAIAIDATVVELTVVSAPLLVAAAAVFGPPAAILVMAAAAMLAMLTLRSLPLDRSPTPPAAATADAQRWSAWRTPRFIFWLLASLAFGHALGAAETGALPLAIRLGGGTGQAAALVAALAVASAVSGVAYAFLGNRLHRGPFTQARVLLALLVLGCLGLGLATNWFAAGAAIVVLGLSTAPLSTVRQVAAEDEAPPERRAEAFSVLFAAHNVGFALSGLLLAALPLSATLMLGGASGLVALLAAPALLRRPAARVR
jgi:MFS family permease